MSKSLVLVGYSGHSYVSIDVAINNGYSILGYCDIEEKKYNPYNLNYLGKDIDSNCIDILSNNDFFFGIGSNSIRYNLTDDIFKITKKFPISLISDKAYISQTTTMDDHGILVMPNVAINSLAIINKGVIINTGAIIEHECIVDEYSHIGPGAVLAGNVKVGKRTFVGANSVVKQGITIGDDVIIGAGSVVLLDVPNGATVIGNPGKVLKIK
jgi:sugar O-acyltransferase (sialic acid O-acetyltransferase NeuD family)